MMIRNLLLISFIIGISVDLLGGDPKYPISEIPEELKKDANVVVREDQMIFKIHSETKATLFVRLVATIFNAKGKRYASEAVYYDKLRKLNSFKASSYDANGELIKKLKPNDLIDQSAADGSSLFNDNRLKIADLMYGSYPYTVEYEYEVEYKFLYSIDGSIIIPNENISIQKASYQLIYPPELAPNYRALNTDQEPQKEKLPDGKESVLWSFENLKSIKLEPIGPSLEEVVPQIIVSSTAFRYAGYTGTMKTWNDFGKWQLALNKDKGLLPETTKQKVKELTNGISSDEEKVKVLYEYLQSKTRYVGIQLGIGGLQPFEASIVDKTGYGDCKALSNYMVSLLDEVGIKGFYTLIEAGSNPSPIDPDFTSDPFNHIIVSVPLNKDTIWLECTNQSIPFGYLGSFTSDRHALMVTEEGGKLVKTPTYSAEQNTLKRNAEVYVDELGNATSKIKTTYAGLQYENGGLKFILNNQYDDQKKWVLNNTDIPSFDLNNFAFTNIKDKVPSAIVELDLTLKRLAAVSGKRLFLTPNLMNRSTLVPEKVENRKTDVIRKIGYTDLDTIRYHLPENIYPEFLPEPVKIKSRFGEYESAYTFDQGVVIYTRKIKVLKGRFPPESYQELTDFYRSINKADNMKLVFLNKT